MTILSQEDIFKNTYCDNIIQLASSVAIKQTSDNIDKQTIKKSREIVSKLIELVGE